MILNTPEVEEAVGTSNDGEDDDDDDAVHVQNIVNHCHLQNLGVFLQFPRLHLFDYV